MKPTVIAIGMCMMVAALIVPGIVASATNIHVPAVAGNAKAIATVCSGEYTRDIYGNEHCKGTYVHV